MTDTKLIIAVAKLDGWLLAKDGWWNKTSGLLSEQGLPVDKLPPYLTSRDAIIPVIEKQTQDVKRRLILDLSNDDNQTFDLDDCVKLLFITPKQLTIALVKSTGNWTEEE